MELIKAHLAQQQRKGDEKKDGCNPQNLLIYNNTHINDEASRLQNSSILEVVTSAHGHLGRGRDLSPGTSGPTWCRHLCVCELEGNTTNQSGPIMMIINVQFSVSLRGTRFQRRAARTGASSNLASDQKTGSLGCAPLASDCALATFSPLL